MLRHVLMIAGVIALANAASAHARDNAAMCQSAAAKAERAHAIPENLLQAITLVETGRWLDKKTTAWPWTVNIAGKSHYFDSRSEALVFAMARAQIGAKSMDLGCFQINTKWHSKNFSTMEEMFDPDAGAAYAASFLTKLYQEFGDWDTAVKSYHSRTEAKGERYAKKIDAVLISMTDDEKQPKRLAVSFTPPPLERFKPGGVDLAIFPKAAPLLEGVGARPLISAENAAWK